MEVTLPSKKSPSVMAHAGIESSVSIHRKKLVPSGISGKVNSVTYELPPPTVSGMAILGQV
jgi:hypothetical protein